MKIYIDRCHGCGQDRGASGHLNEEVMADKLINLVVPKLESLGHTVLAQRPASNFTVSQSLNWRCNQANNWGADIFVSVHNNAGGGYGAEVYTYNRDMLDEAVHYLQYVIDHGGSVHDYNRKVATSGVKDGNELAVIKGTSMKAMLIENFYVDTKSDCDFFSNNIEMFANALVYGITEVDLGTIEIDEMSFEGKQEIENKITVYAHSTDPNVLYKYYHELNGKWTTLTDWQELNRFSFAPRSPGTYKVVCHAKRKGNNTDKEDAYNFINIDVKNKDNVYEMRVGGQYYGQTNFKGIAAAVEKEMENGLKEITLVKK
jgi:hypothetical protein